MNSIGIGWIAIINYYNYTALLASWIDSCRWTRRFISCKLRQTTVVVGTFLDDNQKGSKTLQLVLQIKMTPTITNRLEQKEHVLAWVFPWSPDISSLLWSKSQGDCYSCGACFQTAECFLWGGTEGVLSSGCSCSCHFSHRPSARVCSTNPGDGLKCKVSHVVRKWLQRT